MTSPDFANQFQKTRKTSKRLIGLSILSGLLAFLILLLPTTKIKLYSSPQNPSSYQAILKQYLTILEKYQNPQSLPKVYEESLREAAKNALVFSSEAKVYFPNNQELVSLRNQVENQIVIKFPDLIAQK